MGDRKLAELDWDGMYCDSCGRLGRALGVSLLIERTSGDRSVLTMRIGILPILVVRSSVMPERKIRELDCWTIRVGLGGREMGGT
jgi:hypothetical protein